MVLVYILAIIGALTVLGLVVAWLLGAYLRYKIDKIVDEQAKIDKLKKKWDH